MQGMKIEGLCCEKYSCKDAFKQGESVLVQVRVLNDDDTVVEDLHLFRIEIVVSSARAFFALFGRNTDDDSLPLEIDKEGFIAFEIDASMTARMQGEYFVEIAFIKEYTKLLTDAMPLFEILPSLAEQEGEI